jgi:hypothetical protein
MSSRRRSRRCEISIHGDRLMRKRESDWEVYLRSAPQHSAPVRKTAPPTPGVTTRSIEVGPSEVSPPTAAPAPKDAPGGIVGRIEGLVHDVIDDIKDFLFTTYYHLPLRLIYPRAPAIPVSLEQTVDTLGRLLIRTFQTKQAMQGLTNRYKLDGLETYGRDFLFNQNSKTRRVNNLAELKSALGPNSATEFVGNFMKMAFDEVANTEATEFTGPLTQLSLEDPTQWTIGWTTLGVPVATEY